jgi:DNA-binding SARP family transcriptional activator
MMQFRILGPLEARTAHGELATLTATKHRVLLSMLLLNAGRVVSADRLIDALWPQRPARSAPALLRTYVSAIRTSLSLTDEPGTPRLAWVAGGYRLQMAPEMLDMLVFHDLARQGQLAAAAGDLPLAAERLHGAVSLWRGEPAEDVPLAETVLGVVADLEERYLEAQETWLHARLMLGALAGLIADLRALVSRYPLRERFTELLMRALYAAGRQAEALAAYAQARLWLTEELGIEPGPGLRRLHHDLLNQRDLLAAPAAAGHPAFSHR